MSEAVVRYKAFVDALVETSSSVRANRVRRKQLYDLPSQQEVARLKRAGNTVGLTTYEEQAEYNRMLGGLTEGQRDFVARLLQDERIGAIHDVLAVLQDGEYRIIQEGVELAAEPFGTEIYYDFIARADSEPWPDEDEEAQLNGQNSSG